MYVALMKHAFIIGIILACCTSTGMSAQSGMAPSGAIPVIELEPLFLVDTILLDSGERNSHYTYHLRNTGNAPLIISRVSSSDPCFCSSWKKEPILVGTTCELMVTCPPMFSAHTKKQTFFIHSNAAEEVRFQLERVGIGDRPQAPEPPTR